MSYPFSPTGNRSQRETSRVSEKPDVAQKDLSPEGFDSISTVPKLGPKGCDRTLAV
jgi:hypothetical protein